jgi:plasmid stabilization system protein ParE
VQAKQLIDTISIVVDRLLDHYERDRQRPAPALKPRRQVATGEVTAFRDCRLSIA